MEKVILRDLGGGLILRRANVADAGALAGFNARIHGNIEKDQPDERVGVWTRDLMERPHPTFNVGDFTIVEDTKTGEIVSSSNLISQTWSYGGVPFGVGRSELVGTHPDYRNRGLVRAQYEMIHQWSAGRGELAQAITGIPYFYRKFGYEMGLELGGGRIGYKPQIPKLEDGAEEPYNLRAATEADLSFITQLYQQSTSRYLVNCVWDQDLWRYELNGRSLKNVNRSELRMIEALDGELVGFLAHPPFLWEESMAVVLYELKPGVSWLAVTPSVIRYLRSTGIAYAAQEKKNEFAAFYFNLGSEHPVYQAVTNRLPHVRNPYAWYLRVPDLVRFTQHIAPVLERRLAQSVAGYSGELKLSFYRDGLRFVIEEGRLAQIEAWKPEPSAGSGDAGFPDLTFLQLLFGYRSFEELTHAFADCWFGKKDDGLVLLNAMFPKQASSVWPVS